MAAPIRMVSISLPLRVVRTAASYEVRDARERRIHLYVEDDEFRRAALPHYWRGPEGRALARWIARKLTDAIEAGELVVVDGLGLVDEEPR